MKNLSSEEIDLLRHNARCVVRELGLLNDAYFEIGVTLAERHLLIELASWDSPTMGEIAERLLLDKSTASRLIGKAMKKGYIQYTSDAKDKRKKIIHMTEVGRRTLAAFEPIAFNQTKDALSTLSAEEIELVYRGVALYAKGLKNSRLKNRKLIEERDRLDEINGRWAGLGLALRLFAEGDEERLYEIFREVVDSGNQFPYESNSIQEFHRQFFGPNSQVYVVHSSGGEILGGFFIKPNFSGRSDHIANAAYMIKSTHRGQGIGTLLAKASLEIAKELGFQAMQFNMVFSQNFVALKLYQKLGFNIVGTIPSAIRNPDGNYQTGYVLHRELDM
ncbi:MAG: bifunctional helix-turn-helix transcriptional regulator/GNAT family N-acetyltransferase [Verrucomicrobia bacterium]|nr:bifunctional helix-turn-helix transcriptional regulator/GNAT family N-acetyltransferase [Verrucomicrobiota bacterium]